MSLCRLLQRLAGFWRARHWPIKLYLVSLLAWFVLCVVDLSVDLPGPTFVMALTAVMLSCVTSWVATGYYLRQARRRRARWEALGIAIRTLPPEKWTQETIDGLAQAMGEVAPSEKEDQGA